MKMKRGTKEIGAWNATKVNTSSFIPPGHQEEFSLVEQKITRKKEGLAVLGMIFPDVTHMKPSRRMQYMSSCYTVYRWDPIGSFRSQISDNMDTWKKKVKAREKVIAPKHCVFPMLYSSRESGQSEIKNCAPLRREAHVEVKMLIVRNTEVLLPNFLWLDNY